MLRCRKLRVAYKENKKPWDDCQACRFGQKAEIGQGLTIFILQGRPQRPVRNSVDDLICSHKHCCGYCQTECFQGFLVNDETEVGWLLEWEIGGARSS